MLCRCVGWAGTYLAGENMVHMHWNGGKAGAVRRWRRQSFLSQLDSLAGSGPDGCPVCWCQLRHFWAGAGWTQAGVRRTQPGSEFFNLNLSWVLTADKSWPLKFSYRSRMGRVFESIWSLKHDLIRYTQLHNDFKQLFEDGLGWCSFKTSSLVIHQ